MMIFENVQPQASIAQGPGSNLFNQSVSVGPYYLGKPYTSGDFELIFYRNPYFKPQPAACELDVNLVESTSQITQYLSSGTTDIAGSIDPSSVSADLKNPNIHILDEKALNIMTMQYNVTVTLQHDRLPPGARVLASTNRRFNRRRFSATERLLTTAKESCLRTRISCLIQTSSSTATTRQRRFSSCAIYRNHKRNGRFIALFQRDRSNLEPHHGQRADL